MSNEKDLAVTKFLERPENFSDLFNGSLFQGKQVIKADRLENLPGESALSFTDKKGKKVFCGGRAGGNPLCHAGAGDAL